MDAKGDTISLDLSQLTGEIVAVVDEDQKSKPGLLPTSPAAAKEWLSQKKQTIRPWKQFVNFNRFNMPKNIGVASARVVQNVEHFQSNYLFVFIGLILYCILTSPLLLIAIVAGMGGAYIIRLKSAEGKIKLFNKELTVIQQYCILGMLCFPIFYVAGAGSAVFWVIGASFFTIMLHATMYAIEASTPEESFELQTV
ncbi:prenylated Rab acceptor protein 1 [Dermacentor andersoni]|uniref:prenylated Rab acceptor protein 1 n=1 Tax=Dermacentor andersoni TaxID=34620 RepID=UPI0021556338|nr:prenylated Rab acceptor protein 1-like [Dermacentor andersoni]XP_054926974.1 prenylated Rab acceptor protein 1-like [Dermacentor andersoni]XP_054926975.1 prenylated Rab acceptor protein 1-like [Dermacentor andersoni]XP_054926976.1 prenylated Rab acceptor protein 1-like [Dermacentor andersoni]